MQVSATYYLLPLISSHFTDTVPNGRVVASMALVAIGEEACHWQVVSHNAEHLVDLQCVKVSYLSSTLIQLHTTS